MNDDVMVMVLKVIETELEAELTRGNQVGDFDEGLMAGAAIVMNAFTRTLKLEHEARMNVLAKAGAEYDRMSEELSNKHFLITED